MKINIASTHRFHLLDLARELDCLGYDVKFYSYVPKKRVATFGLRKECISSMFMLSLPFIFLTKTLFKNSYTLLKLKNIVIDIYISLFMRKCDVFIGLGTVYKKSFSKAKKSFNAVTIIEWGSKHISKQKEILEKLTNIKIQPNYFIERSIKGYNLADYIAIASDHVKQSFIEEGIPESKLFQNPYGVDLKMFQPTKLENNFYDIIFVGGWSYRKGCDLLIEVCREKKYKLLHVGPIVDIPFPSDENFTHIDPVNQKELINYYRKAKIFVLPSREEGLAMVQPQALICGLPIVCSKDTGGRDLKQFLNFENQKWIVEIKSFGKKELIEGINQALELASSQIGLRTYSQEVEDKLSWKAYGERYDKFLKKIKNQ